MKEIGTVISASGPRAKVLINRHAACGDCGACQVGREKMVMETIAKNPAHAKPGDTVSVEMQFVSVLKASFIAYGLPLLGLLIGSLIGWYAAPGLGMDQVLTSFFSGILLIAVIYGIIALCEKKGLFHTKYDPVITEISTCKKEENLV